MAWTYDVTLLDTTPLYQVRLLIRDTDITAQLLQDEEIEFVLSENPNIYEAASICCVTIASSFARKADQKVGQVSVDYQSRAKTYMDLANEYEQKAITEGPAVNVYAGGISISDKAETEANADRVDPFFYRDEWDNT